MCHVHVSACKFFPLNCTFRMVVWLALCVSCQSRSSPAGDLSLTASYMKSFPYSGHLFRSLCHFLVLLFFFFNLVRSLSLLAVFKMLVHRGCMFLCLLFYCGLSDLLFEFPLNTRLIFFRGCPQWFQSPCVCAATVRSSLLHLVGSCPVSPEVHPLFIA